MYRVHSRLKKVMHICVNSCDNIGNALLARMLFLKIMLCVGNLLGVVVSLFAYIRGIMPMKGGVPWCHYHLRQIRRPMPKEAATDQEVAGTPVPEASIEPAKGA
jgi:hypothetical protein